MSLFRVTTWPSIPVEPEEVVVYPATLSRDRKTVVYDLDAGVGRVPEPELAIRGLLHLDVDEPDELVAFVGRHGAIQRPWRKFMEAVIGSGLRDRIAVADLQGWLDTAKDLALCWVVAAEEGGDFGELFFQRAGRSAWDKGFLRLAASEGIDERDAWRTLFPILLNIGLREYHLRLQYTLGRGDDEWAIGFGHPDLYCALCFQIHQLIVEDLPLRRCQNETCGQPFVRQQGRARSGQYRTEGIAFCSAACANAQSTRDYRRRLRKKTKKGRK
jgi:hypothetical protein